MDLLSKVLVMDHQDRLTAKQAMAHAYFDPVRAEIEQQIKEEEAAKAVAASAAAAAAAAAAGSAAATADAGGKRME